MFLIFRPLRLYLLSLFLIFILLFIRCFLALLIHWLLLLLLLLLQWFLVLLQYGLSSALFLFFPFLPFHFPTHLVSISLCSFTPRWVVRSFILLLLSLLLFRLTWLIIRFPLLLALALLLHLLCPRATALAGLYFGHDWLWLWVTHILLRRRRLKQGVVLHVVDTLRLEGLVIKHASRNRLESTSGFPLVTPCFLPTSAPFTIGSTLGWAPASSLARALGLEERLTLHRRLADSRVVPKLHQSLRGLEVLVRVL